MKQKRLRVFILLFILLLATIFYLLPYYVSKPGMAKELQPIIEVENGFDEEGSFMLTTVRMGRANMYSYLIAKLSKYQEIYPLDEIRSKMKQTKNITLGNYISWIPQNVMQLK